MRTHTRIATGLAVGALGAALTAPAAVASSHVDVIVVYVDAVTSSTLTTEAVARQHGAQPRWIYEHALEGFAGSVPEGRLQGLRNDPRVDYVELDQQVSIAAQTVPTGIERILADDNTAIGIGGDPGPAVDVDVAVIDTGIDLDHPDLDVVSSTNCLDHSGGPPFSRTYVCDGTGDDGNGHGTHVAGTIGAIDDGAGVVGVAPGARLHAVKVLDDSGSGSWGSVVAGVDWVSAQGDIEVANLSLGGGESQALDDALAAAADRGVALALAAGNSSADVDGYGPAGHPDALTVSALADYDGAAGGGGAYTCRDDVGSDDTFATFSNYGDTDGDDVDVIAPGVCILSTVPGGGYSSSYSGTSMAAPHVAGALALLASNAPNDGTTGQGTHVHSLNATVVGAGNDGWTDPDGEDADDTHEPLLDAGDSATFDPCMVGEDCSEAGNTSPTVEITSPDDGSSFVEGDAVTFTGSATDAEDGDLTASLAWTSDRDGDIGAGESVTTSTLSVGTHEVTATATDGDGASGTASVTVTVTEASSGDPGGITLSATGHKVRGIQHADLTWSGATSANVDVRRDGEVVATTANDGAHTDAIGQRGGGSYTYEVCEAGTTTCSNPATVTF